MKIYSESKYCNWIIKADFCIVKKTCDEIILLLNQRDITSKLSSSTLELADTEARGSLISSLNNFDQEGSSVFVFFSSISGNIVWIACHCMIICLKQILFQKVTVSPIGQPLQTNKTTYDEKCPRHLIVWCSYAIIINCQMFKWKIQSTNPCAKRKCWLDSGADWSFFLQQPTLVQSPGIPWEDKT